MFHESWYADASLEKLTEILNGFNVQGAFIEIGCWEGRSASHIAKQINPQVLHCVDTFKGNLGEGENHDTVVILKERDIQGQFEENMGEYTGGNWKLHVMDGDEFLKELEPPIAFLHLDATHTYEAVKSTLELALVRLAPGGILCGDDWSTVIKAVQDVLPEAEGYGNLWIYKKLEL